MGARAGAVTPLGLAGMSGVIFHLIPHTHWDREWYLPRSAFQARLVAALDDLIERLQADAGYRSFLLDGQTVLLADYLRARPEREPDVKALVKTGRLQVGPWYVLADELIPSGESLIRNLLLGTTDAERLGGRLDVLYSPDAFGHPAAWPTLAREFGIRYGVVWRGLGGETGQERDLYRWRGLDDKEVLLWHLPRAGYEIGAALPADAERLFAAWAPVRGALVQRATSKHVPVFMVPITTAPIRTCRGSAISSPSSTRRARSVCHDSTNSFRPPRTVRSRRPSRVSCAGPIATRGRSRACTGRGRRSNDGIPRPSWRSRAWPSRSRRWRGAREGATAGRCSSSRGVRWCAASSMMPSRAARPTTSRARSSRASRASRHCRGRWCGAVCTISCTTIPMRRAAARRRRRPRS